MQPANLLFILSDQHRRDFAGCYGHPTVQTPNLDRLAARGTRFTHAYTNSPICVPARAALATGRYVHDIGNWDNAFPYTGDVTSWGHRIRGAGLFVDSIGKLHFRGLGTDHGFSQEVEPLHVVDGVGDVLACIREDPPRRRAMRRNIEVAGPGDSTYLQYDRRNGDNGCQWLQAHTHDEQPWVLFLSFVCPHPPFIAPPDLHAYYMQQDLPRPRQWQAQDWPDHPALARMRHFFHLDEDPFTEAELHNLAAAYHGTTTYLDQQIGRVLTTLDELGLTDNTRIIYTSDHGESLGERGHFGKFLMYEETAGIPLIMAGPDVPQGKVLDTPISLIDCYPTILEAVGVEPSAEEAQLPGASLWEIANAPSQNRTVFSEFHAVGTGNAFYMVRDQRYKYVHYVHEAPQFFDLHADPDEVNDLAGAPDDQALVTDFRQRLYDLLDPEAVDARAKADQRARIAEMGGEAAVRAKGAFDNSPTPGEKAKFHQG
ncbi:MAG: sulfatase-like hydrolase/transferase [Caldilineaceae bacterium]